MKKQVDEIIIVDNASKIETKEILYEMKEEINLIENKKNMGIARALNQGIEYFLKKEYKWIITLDHDSKVTEKMISTMLGEYACLKQTEKDKIAMIVPNHIEEKFDKNEIKANQQNYILTEITSGAIVKSEIYKKVGMYEEKLFIDLVDHEYCLRLNDLGYKILQVKSAVLIHNLGETTEKKMGVIKFRPTNHNSLRRYYMMRNRLYVWKKYFKKFPFWVLSDIRKSLSEIVKIVLFEDQKKGKLKMILDGYRDYSIEKFYAFEKRRKK